jgi:DNA-binding SARP family transcriptional activator
MTCYQRSGRETDALATYEQCCEQLNQQMARQPSSRTRLLAESIQQS